MARCCPPCDYQVIPCTIIFQAVVALIAIGPRDFLAKRGMEAFFGNAVDEALKSYSIMNAWCEHNIMHKLFLRCVKHLGKTKDVWHVLVTVKWKCSSAKVNMAVVRRRSLSPVCPMGSCLSRSGPSPMALYVRDSKTRRRYPESNEDGVSRQLLERPPVICKNIIMIVSKQCEWNLRPWTRLLQRVNFQPLLQETSRYEAWFYHSETIEIGFSKIKTCEHC